MLASRNLKGIKSLTNDMVSMLSNENKENKTYCINKESIGKNFKHSPQRGSFVAGGGSRVKKKVFYRKMHAPKMNNPLPNLVPTKGTGYNLHKRLLSQVYVRESKCTLHHVWLDCLWNNDVAPHDIVYELEPLRAGLRFGAESVYIRPEDIFIVGYALDSDIIQPTGSCFLLISKELTCKQARKFMSNVAMNKIKIMQVNTAMFRDNIKNRDLLIFSEAHRQLLDTVPAKAIYKAAGLNPPSQTQPQTQPQTQVENQSKTKPKPKSQTKPNPKTLKSDPMAEAQPLNISEDNILPTKPVKLEPAESTLDIKPVIKKSKRIAAALDGSDASPTIKQEPQLVASDRSVKQEPQDYKAFESMLVNMVDDSNERSDYVGRLYPDLMKFGNLVISVEPLPPKMTLYAFNLMMGTWSIKTEQILALDVPNTSGKPYVTIRIVMKPTDVDAQRILCKNKFRTPYNTVLQIQRSNFKELEKFLMKHHRKIRRLEVDDILPTVAQQALAGTLNFNHVPEWAAGFNLSQLSSPT